MKLSVSDFKDWLDCPSRAIVRHRTMRWTPPGAALSIGTAFHRGLELKLAGKPIVGLDLEACAATCSNPKDGQVARRLLAALNKLELPPLRMKGIEQAFKMPLSEVHDFVGRLDGLGQTEDGKWWSVQGKTIASSRPVAHELERVKNSFHEVGYAALCAQAGIELSGTLLIVGVKASQKAIDAGQTECFYEFLPRSTDAASWSFRNMTPRLTQCANELEHSPLGAGFRNTESCLGKYGNSPCVLYDACHRGTALQNIIDNQLTHPLDDRYADVD